MKRTDKAQVNYRKKSKRTSKTAKDNIIKRKSVVLLGWIPKTKKDVIKMTLIMVAVIAAAGVIPLPHTFAKSLAVPFNTVDKKDASLELGDSRVLQEGQEGSKTVTMSSLQSLWGGLFGWPPMQQKEVSTATTKEPVNKQVVQGARKYQYMICSDGSSRYYTDEQFKDAYTGFTSKSDDSCEKNGQGKMVQLSDTSTGSGMTNSKRTPTVTVRNGCTYTSIPYKTVYRDVTWLNKGETRVSNGSDGTKSSCGWSTDPINEEVLRGTSEPSSGFNPSTNTSTQGFAAYEQCLNSYRSAMSQIQANESQGMGGTTDLKRQAEAQFSSCKRAAGY